VVAEKYPPELQHLLIKYQQLQEQYTAVATERNTVENELKETTRVLEELEKLDDSTPVYKSLGSIMYRVDKKKVIEELSDKKEILELRVKALRKQEELLRSQLQDLQKKIRQVASRLQTQSGSQ